LYQKQNHGQCFIEKKGVSNRKKDWKGARQKNTKRQSGQSYLRLA